MTSGEARDPSLNSRVPSGYARSICKDTGVSVFLRRYIDRYLQTGTLVLLWQNTDRCRTASGAIVADTLTEYHVNYLFSVDVVSKESRSLLQPDKCLSLPGEIVAGISTRL
jgi:hypothetical protein